MRSWVGAVVAVVAAAAGGLYWQSPRWALLSIQQAIVDKDIIPLERYIDWARVREGLRSDLAGALMARTIADSKDGSPGAALGSALVAAVGPAVINGLVDSLVTPAGLIGLIAQREQQQGGRLTLVVDRMAFSAIDEFTVWVGGAGQNGLVRIVMVWDGLHWKVVRVAMPPDLITAMAPPARPAAAAAPTAPSFTIPPSPIFDTRVTPPSTAAAPAGTAAPKRIFYGSRAGEHVTVVASSGLDSELASIRTTHTRDDAIAYCRDYVQRVTEDCIRDELALSLREEITANCAAGVFTDFFGHSYQFKGRNEDTRSMATYVLVDVATGKVADGSSASGYSVNMDLYRALCPQRAPKV
jgi:hypothetical protein